MRNIKGKRKLKRIRATVVKGNEDRSVDSTSDERTNCNSQVTKKLKTKGTKTVKGI